MLWMLSLKKLKTKNKTSKAPAFYPG